MYYYKVAGGIMTSRKPMDGEELTADEYNALKASIKINESPIDPPTQEPTTEERIAALEDELAATKILLGLEE